MKTLRQESAVLASMSILLAALLLPLGHSPDGRSIGWFEWPELVVGVLVPVTALIVQRFIGRRGFLSGLMLAAAATVGAWAPLTAIEKLQAAEWTIGAGALGIWLFVFGLCFLVWQSLNLLSEASSERGAPRILGLLVPGLFGAWLIYLWQVGVTGFDVPSVLLPSPGRIADVFMASTDTLQADFYQTFLKSVLSGFVMGCGSGFLVAVLVDRVPFLQRGLLPLGNFVSALPIVGVAPIMVMWFGFDWQSKAAVVVIMTFFPMLVNTIAGLHATQAMERDLMRSYGASYLQTLVRVRLPNALPFIFNALKINSTLALIGAIVAEFFGTPIVGMGFRISTEIGRMNVEMVWATIAVAAVAGSLFYGLLAVAERATTFWHPSYR
ncbi:ABC transporter permease [Pelagibius litoralis]|uniref:ABC transporter permease n=1 Tax=Pelagibius litoralis TaxID=374515 RepID=A0A967C5B5_9PROT|nr:ABC transporter permease [Pelagibius litoralis]NIA67691.1 ABC transporter permease [Pelagibius litoralis]